MYILRLYRISHHPLNYHTYLSRIKKLPKIFKSESPIEQQSILLDLIKANRTIQTIKPQTTRLQPGLDLGLTPTPNNATLESDLKQLLFNNISFRKHAINDITIVKQYLLYEPRPKNVQDLIEVTSDFFQSQLTDSKEKKIVDTSVVYITLGRILEQNDYFNGFNLIDKTVNSDQYLNYRKSRLEKLVGVSILANVCILTLQWLLLPDIPILLWMAFNTVSTFLITSIFHIPTVSNLGRIKFRFYNSRFYNYLHKHELLATNKIITHLEEFNETNLINFHYSKVRPMTNLKQVKVDDYIIELPNIYQDNVGSDLPNEEISQIQKFFKTELNKRKIMLCDLNQELLFLEYWKNHGEGFTWVEPDQDPGEIIKLNISNK
ncbi:hypothetical protein JA1_001197 [Spathaspora sp. JA1]|nr:hypothetical protein JA1_001197 [Spathaspora sp. JA1]